MTTGKKFYWLKLSRDFFKRHDIKIIEAMENGKDYILFYLKLLVESIDHEGRLRFSDTIPYDERMLSVITSTNIDIVRAAIKMFTQLGLMEMCDDKTIYMTETQKMLGYENKSTERVKVFREKQQLIEERKIPIVEPHINNKRYGGFYYKVLQRDGYKCAECESTEKLCVHHIVPYDTEDDETVRMENLVTLCQICHSNLYNKKPPFTIGDLPSQNILTQIGFDETLQKRYRNIVKRYKEIDKELDIEKEKDIEKDKDIKASNDAMSVEPDDVVLKTVKIDYNSIALYWNTHSLLKEITKITDQRKPNINARVKEHGIEAVYKMIDNAGRSPFLRGDNSRGFTANFDWCFKPKNFTKVLEGNYVEGKNEKTFYQEIEERVKKLNHYMEADQ